MRLTIDLIPSPAGTVSLERYRAALYKLAEGQHFPPRSGDIESDGMSLGTYSFQATANQNKTDRINVHGVMRQLISIRESTEIGLEAITAVLNKASTLNLTIANDYKTPAFTTTEFDNPAESVISELPMRYIVQCFDTNGRRMKHPNATGFNTLNALMFAFSGAIGDERVGSVLVRDMESYRPLNIGDLVDGEVAAQAKVQGIMSVGDDDEFRGINSSGDRVVDYPEIKGQKGTTAKAPDIQTAETMIENQNRVFIKLGFVCDAFQKLPPVVDDDYPERRHMFDACLRDLILALDTNGNLDRIKAAAVSQARARGVEARKR